MGQFISCKFAHINTFKKVLPACGYVKAAKYVHNVDLPDPEGPMMARNSPFLMVTVTLVEGFQITSPN
jgi:hypothetical protein